MILQKYTVNADRATGNWIGEAYETGEIVDGLAWLRQSDTHNKYFDTWERDGVTVAVEVTLVD